MIADRDALCVDADGHHAIDDDAAWARLMAAVTDPDSIYDREGRAEIRKRRLLAVVSIVLLAFALRRRGGVSVPATGEGPPTAPLVGGW